MAKKKSKLGLDTSDHVYTNEENEKIKFLKLWAFIGPITGFIIGFLLQMFI